MMEILKIRNYRRDTLLLCIYDKLNLLTNRKAGGIIIFTIIVLVTLTQIIGCSVVYCSIMYL